MTTPDARTTKDDIFAQTARMGITPDYISVLVDSFYGRIHTHEVLGPIFKGAIGENWDPHLSQMKKFWASVALGSGTYSGRPVPAHHKHRDSIESHHFDIWLGLFRETLEDTAPSVECVDYFMVRANRIAKSLKLALFGVPGLGTPRFGD